MNIPANAVLEAVHFRLKDGVKPEDFIQHASAVQQRLEHYAGFLHRKLYQNADGQWLDLVWWASYEQAIQGAEQLMQEAIAQNFLSDIDMSNLQMNHLHLAAFNIPA